MGEAVKSSRVDVVHAGNMKPGDLYAGDVNPDAPTRPVQEFATAHRLTEVTRYTEGGRQMLALQAGQVTLTPVPAATQVLLIREGERGGELTAEQVARYLAQHGEPAGVASASAGDPGEKWFTREGVRAAFETAVGEVTRIAGEDQVLDLIGGAFADEMDTLEVSRDQAVTVFGNAADMCKEIYNPGGGETSDTVRSDSVGDLIVNLAAGLLGDPERGTDEIIADSWASLTGVDFDGFQVWNQHGNELGDACGYSGQRVTPEAREELAVGLDPDDQGCPQGCPGSCWTDPDPGTAAHRAAIAATVKGWVA
jgi:hypothetical protein